MSIFLPSGHIQRSNAPFFFLDIINSDIIIIIVSSVVWFYNCAEPSKPLSGPSNLVSRELLGIWVVFCLCFHIELTKGMKLGDTLTARVVCNVGGGGSAFSPSVDSPASKSWVWVSGPCNWGKWGSFSGLLFSDVWGYRWIMIPTSVRIWWGLRTCAQRTASGNEGLLKLQLLLLWYYYAVTPNLLFLT